MRHSMNSTILTAFSLLLFATSAAAFCSVAPDSLNYSSAIIGEVETLTFVITNEEPDAVSGVLSFSGYQQARFSFDGGVSSRAYDLGPGESETVAVHFTALYGGVSITNINLGTIGADCERSYVPCYAYGIQPPAPGEPDCSVSPSIYLDFPMTVVGGHAVESVNVSNIGLLIDNHYEGAGLVVGDMPTIMGEFSTPWGGPFEVSTWRTWDIDWNPVTPGWQETELYLGPMCEYPGVPLMLRGLALIEGVECSLSTTDMDFGLVAVGETGYGSITVENMGTEPLPLVLPQVCEPFTIVDPPNQRTLASGEEFALYVRFTPTEPGLQTCELDMGNAACEPVLLSGVGLADDGITDRIGIWFEQSGTTDQLNTTTPFETVTAYLMILNPSTDWGASGWECCVELVGNGVAMSWDLAGDALNVETPPCFSVGMQSGALLGSNVILLSTLTFLQPDPDAPTFLYIHPVSQPSLPGVPVYADGLDPGNLIALAPASGSETMPVATVNAPPTGVPEAVSETALTRARPNPFNPSTTLSFSVAFGGPTRLAIHDMRGRLVRALMDEDLPGGDHERVWDGRDDAGRTVQSGVYFARLISGDERRMMKVMLLK